MTVLLYGGEIWLLDKHLNPLSVPLRCLRRVCGILLTDHMANQKMKHDTLLNEQVCLCRAKQAVWY